MAVVEEGLKCLHLVCTILCTHLLQLGRLNTTQILRASQDKVNQLAEQIGSQHSRGLQQLHSIVNDIHLDTGALGKCTQRDKLAGRWYVDGTWRRRRAFLTRLRRINDLRRWAGIVVLRLGAFMLLVVTVVRLFGKRSAGGLSLFGELALTNGICDDSRDFCAGAGVARDSSIESEGVVVERGLPQVMECRRGQELHSLW